MIRTVTLNTGFDELFTVSALEPGGVTEAREHRTLASGKGINAARTIAALGEPVKAYGLVGKADRDLFRRLLEREVDLGSAGSAVWRPCVSPWEWRRRMWREWLRSSLEIQIELYADRLGDLPEERRHRQGPIDPPVAQPKIVSERFFRVG